MEQRGVLVAAVLVQVLRGALVEQAHQDKEMQVEMECFLVQVLGAAAVAVAVKAQQGLMVLEITVVTAALV
jgi:L-asparaginase II